MVQRSHDIWTQDVFLNFRGTDTRNGFVGNLYNALRQRGINTFFDEQDLKRGEEITENLFKAIKESQIAIVVFSENYASSSYCLKELVLILQGSKEEGRFVLPIFYDVEPSQVRYQKGSYGEALVKHEKRYGKEKLQEWKSALSEAANLKGWHFETSGNESEYDFIGSITKEVSNKINQTPLHVTDYPVGLESRVQKVKSLLDVESTNKVSMVGIHGIGGMGKTTIARAVYNLLADQFEGACFLNVRTLSDKHGLLFLQKTLLFELVGEEDIKLGNVSKGMSIIRHRLHQKKVLLVLDDVDQKEHLKALAGRYDWFGNGSRIIITTRDKHLLVWHKVEDERMYEVQKLNDEEALQLFRRNAFKEEPVPYSYLRTSKRAVSYCSGLPLALEVIGSNFYGKRIEEWNSALDGYERAPDKEIFRVLKMSYDTLDDIQKEIFLAVACFFKGKKLKDVKDMLQSVCGIKSEYAIGVLIDRSLIKIEYDRLTMHDLVQDMGREIIKQASPSEPGDRSRLWSDQHVLQENTIMARKLDSIEDVDDSKETWKLAIRIINLWCVPRSPSSAGFMKMIFMDKKGDKIQAQVKNHIENRKKELKEGSSYIVQNFEVENNSGEYKATNHPFKLNFVKATILEKYYLPEIPQYIYNFTRFEDILGRHACADVLVDVIGQFVDFVDIHLDSKKKKVVFTMKNQRTNILNCTLWGQNAIHLVSSLDKLSSSPVVLLLTLAKIKYLNGSILIQNSWYSKLFINENIPEIDQFKNTLEDNFFHNTQVKSLAEINKLKQECICVTVATIDKVIVKNGWKYDGCSKCTRKGDPSVPSFKCLVCGHNEISPRFRIEVKVSHQKENAKFILWNQESFQLIKETAEELKKKLMDEGEMNPMAFPIAIDNILRRTLAFRVKVQPSNNCCSVNRLSEDASIIESILQKIPSIQDSATTEKGKSICYGHEMDDLYDSQSLPATADYDLDLLGSVIPAKRLTSDTQLDDLAYEDLTSIQLSSTELTKRIKTK